MEDGSRVKLIKRGSMNPQCTSQPWLGSVWAKVFLRHLAVLMDVLCTHSGALGGFMNEGESARCRDWVVGDCDWVNGALGDLRWEVYVFGSYPEFGVGEWTTAIAFGSGRGRTGLMV